MAKLSDVRDALLTVTENVGHYEAMQETDRYIVWAEDGQADSVWADGRMIQQGIQGTIDFYTKSENDPFVLAIQNALNGAGISFRLSSVQYEDETKFIHFEWIFEVGRWG